MRIAELYKRHRGKPIWIIGTGPSMRLFPLDVLRGEICIGLNQAYRYAPLTYSITVHPELLVEYLGEPIVYPTQWIVKAKAPLYLPLEDPSRYVFHTTPDLAEALAGKMPDTLYIGRGVQQTAMHMAALMGAEYINLVGVDMTDLGGDHHAHDQHVRFHGLAPKDVYAEYREYTAAARKAIADRFHIPVLTMSPLLGADHGTEDYLRQCTERGFNKLPKPKDTSAYLRKPNS